MGLGAALTVALVINGLGLLAIQASMHGQAPILLGALWLLTNIGIPIYNINQVSFRQTVVPDKLQGRMNATMRSFGYGAATIGAFIGGILGAQYGILPVMTAGAVIALLPVLLIHFGPLGRLNDIPQTRL
jgi:predicted MFS family arabinose efflux permease